MFNNFLICGHIGEKCVLGNVCFHLVRKLVNQHKSNRILTSSCVRSDVDKYVCLFAMYVMINNSECSRNSM